MKHTRSARKALIAFTGTALALMLTFSFLPLLRANAKDYTAVKSADPDEEIQVTLTPDKVTCTMGETTQVDIDLDHTTGLDLAFTNAKEPKILGEGDDPTGDDSSSSDPDDSEATYTFTGDKTWTKASKKDMSFKVTKNPDHDNMVFEEFIRLEMDDKGAIEADNYEATFGSIDIKLKADYLETLSNGKHTLKVVLADRTLTAEFTVFDDSNTDGSNTDSPATDSPATGEAVTWVVICAVLLVLSCGGISFVFVRRRVND